MVPPPYQLTPAEAMKLWYHLQCTEDDSAFWNSEEVSYDDLTREQLIVATQSHGLAAGGKKMDMVRELQQWSWYLQNIQKITMEKADASWLEDIQDEDWYELLWPRSCCSQCLCLWQRRAWPAGARQLDLLRHSTAHH